MKALIVEDEFITRKIIQKILSEYGNCDVAVDGEEAINAFNLAWEEKEPYDLICMDIMMPKINGQEALKKIRELENEMKIKPEQAAKVIMVSSIDDAISISSSFKMGATAYIVKPVEKHKILDEVRNLGLIK